MMCTLSTLDANKADALKKMEQQMGKTLLAYSCNPTEPAALSDNEVKQLQDFEQKLGLVLIAVKS